MKPAKVAGICFVALLSSCVAAVPLTASKVGNPCDFLLSNLYTCVDDVAVFQSQPSQELAQETMDCCGRYALYTQARCFCPSCTDGPELLQNARRYGLEMLHNFCQDPTQSSSPLQSTFADAAGLLATPDAHEATKATTTPAEQLLSVPLPDPVTSNTHGSAADGSETQVALDMQMTGAAEKVWTPEDVAAALDRSLELAATGGSAAARTNANGDISVEIEYNVAGANMKSVAGNIRKVMDAVQATLSKTPEAVQDGRQVTVDVSVELHDNKSGQQSKATRTLGGSDDWTQVLSDSLKKHQGAGAVTEEVQNALAEVAGPQAPTQAPHTDRTLASKALDLLQALRPAENSRINSIRLADGFEATERAAARAATAAAKSHTGAFSGSADMVEFYDYPNVPTAAAAAENYVDYPAQDGTMGVESGTALELQAELVRGPGALGSPEGPWDVAQQLLQNLQGSLLQAASPIANMFGQDLGQASMSQGPDVLEHGNFLPASVWNAAHDGPLRPPARKGLVIFPLHEGADGVVSGAMLHTATEQGMAAHVAAAEDAEWTDDTLKEPMDIAVKSEDSFFSWATVRNSWIVEHYWDVLMVLSIVNLLGVSCMAYRLWQLEHRREEQRMAAGAGQFLTQAGNNMVSNPLAAVQRLLQIPSSPAQDLEAPLLAQEHSNGR